MKITVQNTMIARVTYVMRSKVRESETESAANWDGLTMGSKRKFDNRGLLLPASGPRGRRPA